MNAYRVDNTADADIDDPTIRRCLGFAKSWVCGSIEVVNLFAYRTTNPAELMKWTDPIGPEVEGSEMVIMAWGTIGTLLARNKSVLSMLKSYKPLCLEKSKHDIPSIRYISLVIASPKCISRRQ